MIVICIGDGLGNQMFQYAFYLAMRNKYKEVKVCVDICNFYGSYNNHNGYELNRVFGLQPKECSNRMAIALADFHRNSFKKHPIINALYGIRQMIWGRKSSFIIQDDATSYYKEVFELNPLYSYMLRGNWINEKYFHDVKDDVYKAFIFKDIEDEKNKEVLEEIKNSLSVSVHVRRGDFLNYNSCLDNSFYVDAINYLKENIGDKIMLFVFSDDIAYCEKIFSNYSDVYYVKHNKGADSYKDMQLMSMCKHNIIANSTFSFWGAYLNQNPNKIVIAPQNGMEDSNNAFACEDWIKL